MKLIRQIPNLMTLCNLLCGCLGIIFALQAQDLKVSYEEKTGIPHLYIDDSLALSCYFIFIAAVFDFFDGLVARWLKADSAMGVQLDSLADMVSFGVFPGIILYKLLTYASISHSDALQEPSALHYVALLIPAAACWRLARFNLSAEHSGNFKGLPSPANGLFMATLPLIYHFNSAGLMNMILNPWVLVAVCLLFSYLMISGIPMFSFKIKSAGWKGNEIRILFLLASVALIGVFHVAGLAAAILLYILLSGVLSLIEESKEV